MSGWIGVDLDGTLAQYDSWRGPDHIGLPVPAMYERVTLWLREGIEVRIFTARVSDPRPWICDEARQAIENWCLNVFGQKLPVTNVKDFGMVELWDDRAITVEKNTGQIMARPNATPSP